MDIASNSLYGFTGDASEKQIEAVKELAGHGEVFKESLLIQMISDSNFCRRLFATMKCEIIDSFKTIDRKVSLAKSVKETTDRFLGYSNLSALDRTGAETISGMCLDIILDADGIINKKKEMNLPEVDDGSRYDLLALLDAFEIYRNRQIPETFPRTNINSSIMRETFISEMGFCMVAYDWVRELAKLLEGKKCLEIMAGSGCLSKALQDCGIDIIATDSYQNEEYSSGYDLFGKWRTHFTDVEKLLAIEAIEKYGKDMDIIVCSWPPYNSCALTHALDRQFELNPNTKVIYIGEDDGGCTADYSFFEKYDETDEDSELTAEVNRLYKRWYSICDSIYLVTQKR